MQGYSAVFINNLTTATYLILVKWNSAASQYTTNHLLFFNALFGLPMLVSLASYMGEGAKIAEVGFERSVKLDGDLGADRLLPFVFLFLQYEHGASWGFRGTLIMSCIAGACVNHATFLASRTTSPLATAMTGSIKSVVMTVVGALAFPDFKWSLYNGVGLLLSTLGALWYTVAAGKSA